MQNTSPVKSSEDDLGGGLWWEGFAIDDSLTNSPVHHTCTCKCGKQ